MQTELTSLSCFCSAFHIFSFDVSLYIVQLHFVGNNIHKYIFFYKY